VAFEAVFFADDGAAGALRAVVLPAVVFAAGAEVGLRATTLRAAAPARLTRERRLEVAMTWGPIPGVVDVRPAPYTVARG
jgi:hypothetical protein